MTPTRGCFGRQRHTKPLTDYPAWFRNRAKELRRKGWGHIAIENELKRCRSARALARKKARAPSPHEPASVTVQLKTPTKPRLIDNHVRWPNYCDQDEEPGDAAGTFTSQAIEASYHHASRLDLWRNVLLRAFDDADGKTSMHKGPTEAVMAAARAFLRSGNPDFFAVCQFANLDPDWVRKLYRLRSKESLATDEKKVPVWQC